MGRRLRESCEAITPAVGTILMVVVMVAMAAGLSLAWKAHVSESMDEQTPPVGFLADEERRVAVVVRASGTWDWFRDAAFPGTCVPTLNGGPFPASAGIPLREGDALGCGPGESLVVAVAGTVLYSHTFH